MRHASLSVLGLLAATATASQGISPNPFGTLIKRQDDRESLEKEREERRKENLKCLDAFSSALGPAPQPPTAVVEYINNRPAYTPTEEEYENGGPLCTRTFPASLSDDVTSFFSSYTSWWATRSYELDGVVTYVCRNETQTGELTPMESDGCDNGGFVFTGPGVTTFAPLEDVPFTTPPDTSATPTPEADTSALPSSDVTETGTSPSQVDDDSGAAEVTGVLAAGVLVAAGVVGVLVL